MGFSENRRNSLCARLSEARQILNLDEVISFQDVQKAYHQQSRRWHPDQHAPGEVETATLQMQKINEAYRVLKDYFYRLQVSLRPEDISEALDPESWWESRFGQTFWSDDGKKG